MPIKVCSRQPPARGAGYGWLKDRRGEERTAKVALPGTGPVEQVDRHPAFSVNHHRQRLPTGNGRAIGEARKAAEVGREDEEFGRAGRRRERVGVPHADEQVA